MKIKWMNFLFLLPHLLSDDLSREAVFLLDTSNSECGQILLKILEDGRALYSQITFAIPPHGISH